MVARFVINSLYKIEEIISTSELSKKIKEIAAAIREDFSTSEALVFVGILRGSMIFLADLLRSVNLVNATVDFMFISSYGNELNSSGNVKIIKDLEENITNKDVIIVEDIVDTGLTLQAVVTLLQQRNPKSLKVCALLNKPSKRKVSCYIDYVGFNIEDYFVVGYGIDYAQKYRSLPYIGKLMFNKS